MIRSIRAVRNMLQIKNLQSSIDGKKIIHGIDLTINSGELHVIMGPNGSGKTSLAMTLMGQPAYTIKFPISNFQFQINGKDVSRLTPEERARAGLFVSFQSPIEITGVSFLAFVRTAAKSLRPHEKISLSQFKEVVKQALRDVALEENFMHRSINEGFSGGERKRAEIAQLIILKPSYAVLDEIDSGLDIDSLKIIAEAIKKCIEDDMGVLLITHYQRILKFLKPDKVHVLIDGKIKHAGDMKLVEKIEQGGYAAI